jgi:thioester reductase-like protein
VIGNLSHPNFDLSTGEYSALAQDIGCIYHNAAKVHAFATYEMLKDTNVTATLQILKLSMEIKLKKLVFISTISVLDKSKAELHQYNESTELTHFEPRFMHGYG